MLVVGEGILPLPQSRLIPAFLIPSVLCVNHIYEDCGMTGKFSHYYFFPKHNNNNNNLNGESYSSLSVSHLGRVAQNENVL